MTDPLTTISSSSTFARPQQIYGEDGSRRDVDNIQSYLAPLTFNNRSSSNLGLPKLMPRSAVTRSSLSTSPTNTPSLVANNSSEPDHDLVGDVGSSRSNSQLKKVGRLSMMDFLAAESQDENILLPPSADTDLSKSATSSTSNGKQSSSRVGGRKSLNLVPRLGSLGNSSVSPSDSSSTAGMSKPESNGEKSLPSMPTLPTRAESPQPKTWDFLSADRHDEGGSPHSIKGKCKAKTKSTPLIQLKVIPVTDSINMFGSTQTSSNYSLSGMVFVQLNSRERRDGSASVSPIKRQGSPFEVTPDSSPGNSNVRGKSPRPSDTSEVNGDVQSEEIHIKSLQVIFSGFALYIDHTGRFSAMRLAHVKQELLSHGASIPPVTGPGQEYEIEFNLSVPGWLPSTLSTRFGGTFYCLEAKVEYSNASDRTPMTALVPPRRTSRAASPSPLSSSLDGSSYDSDPPALSASGLNKDDQLRKLLGSHPKDRDVIPTLTSGGNRKGSWLSKLAKVSKASGSSGPNSLSSTVTTPTQMNSDATSPTTFFTPSAMQCSNVDGISYAQSKAKAIIVARCREVVPVPVARMAIIGPEGLPEGAHQDPPPMIRSSSFDAAATRSRSSTITRTSILASPSPRRTQSPPPLAPSAFTAPSDPAKLAAHSNLIQPRTPQRASSATQIFHPRGGAPHSSPISPPTSNRNSRSQNSPYSSSSTIPMRHFLHRPMLHPPADAQIQNVDGGLQFSLTLTLPSYVSIDGPGSDVLSFGVQIEVGRSASWSKVRELGGLRLRDMELSCVQTERHSSVASRTFCHSYPLPLDNKIGPHELPIMESWRGNDRERTSSQQDAATLRTGYDRAMIEDHMELVRQGRAPLPSEQNVERVRVAVVGPPSSHGHSKGQEGRNHGEEGSKGKDKEKEAKEASVSRPPVSKKVRRRSMPTSVSAPSGLAGNLPSREGSSDSPLDDFAPPLPDREDSEANKKTTGRGRRAYQSAIRGLSNLATAVMDITLDTEGGGYGPPGNDGNAQKRKSDDEAKQTAIYSFAGSDGYGVDLTRGRVRMAINLPLVNSNVTRAKMAGTPRLVSDFESPYIRVRHKLKVKLGFGFGSKPLGGEGDGNWGQALVMCVPVRFTDSAPREVREQFAPMPIAQVASSVAGLPSNIPKANKVSVNDAPLLPSYNQLFREDGSRLADEGEDLPQYPGPAGRRISAIIPSSGSVTAPSPSIGSNGEIGVIDEFSTFDNRITPSRVLDESLPDGIFSDVSQQQQLELQEMEEENVQQQIQTADRLNETVNMDDEMDDEFGEEDAIGVFSSSNQEDSSGENEYHSS